MKAIRENIVGLFRFIILLFSVFVFPARKLKEAKTESPRQRDKYESITGSPTVPLVPVETQFCPKCHVAVAQVRHTKQGTEIIRKGKSLITVGSITVVQDGKERKGLPIRCPNGHIVRIE